jgi:hypothetical protein
VSILPSPGCGDAGREILRAQKLSPCFELAGLGGIRLSQNQSAEALKL